MTDAPLEFRFPPIPRDYVHTAGAYTVLNNVYYRILGTAATLAASAEGWQMNEVKINPGFLVSPGDWQERDDCMEIVEAMAGQLDEVSGVLMEYLAAVADDAHTNKEPE